MSNTVIQLKYSTASGNTPSSLEYGELAINLADGKLFYKDSNNQIDFIQNFQGPAGLNGEVQFNDSGVLGADSGFSYDKSNNILSVEKVRINLSSDITGTPFTTNSNVQATLLTFSTNTYGSGKFIIQATEGTKRQVTEILVVHNGTTAYATEYAIIRTDGNLFSLDVDLVSSNVRLRVTSTSSNTTNYKVHSNLLLL